ncbi:hypothetical protein ACFSKU_11925 [Pontibacter silvestris]|uniref:Cupin 2 conserved barrel domain-containing protein n=1 Tax=Pontibacter silvestris TaxID=2305183 RepID=A0ABW4WY82_9BACT|nr:hypothetical protein [Pontibacter silvestris]MCC9135273.1 hypothetical protein [Pontibacter silvestris]
MIKAYKLYTDSDGQSCFTTGLVSEKVVTEAVSIRFQETAPYSSYDWHPAPITQYVITLAGTLEFTTSKGETFILHPGEVLIAMDTTGAGHKWRIIDDQPWKRAYVVFEEGADINFVPESH